MATSMVTTVAKSASTTAKAVKTKKSIVVSKKPKVSSELSHPPYIEMIRDAVSSLKERTGSSPSAIAKFIEGKQSSLPSNFKKLLFVQLKRLVAAGKLVKVKNSFKLSPALSKPKSVNLVKKTTDAKQVKASDKGNTKTGSKRKADSSDKPTKTKKAAKTPARATPGKKPQVAKAMKKSVVEKLKKSAVSKVKKPKSVKSVGRKVQMKE